MISSDADHVSPGVAGVAVQREGQLGAFFGTSSSPDASRASLLSLKANFAKALAVMADVAQHPSFPQAEVERQRASRMGALSQQREEASAVATGARRRRRLVDSVPSLVRKVTSPGAGPKT